MGNSVCVIGADPGFASFGASIIELLPDREIVHNISVFRTKKSVKKINVKAADDNFRRAQYLAKSIEFLIKKWKPMAIAAETMSFPRNASAAAKVAMSWGILAYVCSVYEIPMVQASPQEIKGALCDNKSATKKDIQEALERRYISKAFAEFKYNYPEGQWEHGFDSVGAVVACLNTEVLKMARRISG